MKEELSVLKALALSCGFTHCTSLDISSVRLLEEVRQMCAQNTCRQYGKTWCCPPGLGTLEECEARIRSCRKGILLQTVGTLEDAFDVGSMQRIMDEHKSHFQIFRQKITPDHPGLLAIGSGGCSLCEKCTYPDRPCRYPEKACGSMEGYGMLVTEVCRQNGLGYYYGPGTLAYTSCILFP